MIRYGRERLPQVQAECAAYEGVSVIIYDQVCATEKRRRRKRGKMAAADVKVSINPRVCENCGDCTEQSHCIAIEPIDTEYGRKRRISPTSCNTDLSCLKGFCPSFVTSATDAPKRDDAEAWKAREAELAANLPDPVLPDLATPWRGLFAGIGGGGIVTAGADRRHGRLAWRASRSARSTSPAWRRRTARSCPTCKSPTRSSTWFASRPARPM